MLKRSLYRKLRGTGILLGILLFAVACAHSPQEELSKARIVFMNLERSDASLYIPEEIHKIRNRLHHAEEQIRANRFASAEKEIRDLLQGVNNSFILYQKRKELAKQQSVEFLSFFEQRLSAIHVMAQNMPRLTYVDQNRYDIVRSRLNSLEKQLRILKKILQKREFLNILKEAPLVRQQLKLVQHSLQDQPERQYIMNKIDYSYSPADAGQTALTKEEKRTMISER